MSISKLDLKDLKTASKVFRAVNHPLRLSIIKLVEEHAKLSVTQIYFKMRIEQSVASQHLAILRESEILVPQRDGKNIYYTVNNHRISSVVDCSNLFKSA
jgi:DNA-binding transcriptional ArsR family regulator